MTRLILLAAAVALCGCGDPQAGTGARSEDQIGEAASHLPFHNSTGFLDGYSLRVSRQGDLRWNGAPITETELVDYLDAWASLPKAAGPLFVAFEPGVADGRAKWVRLKVLQSDLCEQQRCAEVGWNVKRPVVY